MRVLALSWDADRPGTLDSFALRLGQELAGAPDTEVHVVAAAAGPASTGHVDGVTISWVAEAPPVLPPDSDYDLSRVLAFSSRAFATAERLQRQQPADVVFALGWQTAYAAANLHATHRVPVVAVLPTIELVRRGDLSADHAQLVHQVEWWLTYEARRVVTTSRYVRRELARGFRLPPTKLDVVPAGTDVPEIPEPAQVDVLLVAPPEGRAARAASAAADVLASLGVAVTLSGPRSAAVGSAGRCADVVVVTDPDRGVTVIDAMAHGRAVVVPERGPLRDLVHARRSGLRVDPTDATALVAAVRALLADPVTVGRLGRAAVRRVQERHRWNEVAARYRSIAEFAITEEALLRDQHRRRRPLRPALLSSPLLRLEPAD